MMFAFPVTADFVETSVKLVLVALAAYLVLNGSFCMATVYFGNCTSSSVVQRMERRLERCQIHLKAVKLPGYMVKQ